MPNDESTKSASMVSYESAGVSIEKGDRGYLIGEVVEAGSKAHGARWK